MQLIELPNTDLRPSTLCLGTAGLGSVVDQAAAFKMLDLYTAQGGNVIDTAKVYADWLPGERSASEKTIGRWLRRRRNRAHVILMTKGGHPALAAMQIPRLSPAELVADLNASLKNLQVDSIDLYWLHRDDVRRPVEDILEPLWRQVALGKIRYVGCSNWRLARIKAAQACAGHQGQPGFVANQAMWSLAAVDPLAMPDQTMVAMDSDLKQYHRETGLPALAYSSQANGWFHRRATGTTGHMDGGLQRMYGTAVNEARFRRVQQLAKTSGRSTTEVILGYLLGQPFPVIPILGCQTMVQLQDSLSAGDRPLSPEQIAYLEQAESLQITVQARSVASP